MSQHDLDIANQGFQATRADINNALQALGSSNSGATAPSTTYANQLWYDTANNIIKIRNEDNDAWISLLYLDQTNDAVAQFDVDNIRIDGNTISSTDTDGDITLDPNGTGKTVIAGTLDMNGGQLILDADADTSITADTDDRIDFRVGGSDKLHLNVDGKMLFNTTSSDTNDVLQIESPASGGGYGIQIRRNDNNTDQQVGSIRFGNTSDSDLSAITAKTDGAANSGAISFSTANAGTTSERMRIHKSGLVSIGSTAVPGESCQLFVDDVLHLGSTQSTNSGIYPTSGLGIICQSGSYIATLYDDNNLTTPRFRFDRNGNLVVSGSVSKGSGSFRIDHPLSSKSATHDLVHSFLEGPKADLIYRGKVDLVAGSATVNIDTASGMTDGTFVLLCGDVQCFTSNEDGFTAVKGSVSGNTLTITAESDTCTDTISWMVVGERKDQHMIDTTWTDDNGKVIVEPLKEAAE